MRSEFRVSGMTCEHCENRVAREVSEVPGVVTATADAGTGALTVTSEGALEVAAVADAVEEAGYVLLTD